MSDFVEQAYVSLDNAHKSMVTGLFCDGKSDITPALLAPSLRHRAKYVDILVQKKGINTTITEENYFVVSLALHFKASPFGDG